MPRKVGKILGGDRKGEFLGSLYDRVNIPKNGLVESCLKTLV